MYLLFLEAICFFQIIRIVFVDTMKYILIKERMQMNGYTYRNLNLLYKN